jgi:hypothetical protein
MSCLSFVFFVQNSTKIVCACYICCCWLLCILYDGLCLSVVVGWFPRAGAMPPCPHAVAVLPPLPHALRNGKLNNWLLNCSSDLENLVCFIACDVVFEFEEHLKKELCIFLDFDL